jgi:hypothetical protein
VDSEFASAILKFLVWKLKGETGNGKNLFFLYPLPFTLSPFLTLDLTSNLLDFLVSRVLVAVTTEFTQL